MGKINSKKVCRIVGVWDLLLTLPFALPLVNVQVIKLLSIVHSHVSPTIAFPIFYDLHVFFVQLFGILAVLWAVVRMVKPSAYLSLFDMIGRFAVAAMMLYYSYKGTSNTILIFSASELVFGIIQAVVLIKEKIHKKIKAKKEEF